MSRKYSCFVLCSLKILKLIFISFCETRKIESYKISNIPVLYNDDNMNSFPLCYFKNIGVQMCLNMCESFSVCDRVYFDREMMQCELRKEFENGDELHDDVLAGRITSEVNVLLKGGQKSFEVERRCCDEVSLDTNIVMVNFSSVNQNSREKLDEFRLQSDTSWTVNKSDPDPYISVIFDKDYWVTSVITQGRADVDQWITSYNVASLNTENIWTLNRDQSGKIKLFRGNNDTNSMVQNRLYPPVHTGGLRVYPKDYHGYMSMRLGIKGYRNINPK